MQTSLTTAPAGTPRCTSPSPGSREERGRTGNLSSSYRGANESQSHSLTTNEEPGSRLKSCWTPGQDCGIQQGLRTDLKASLRQTQKRWVSWRRTDGRRRDRKGSSPWWCLGPSLLSGSGVCRVCPKLWRHVGTSSRIAPAPPGDCPRFAAWQAAWPCPPQPMEL